MVYGTQEPASRGIEALTDVSMQVRRGEIVSILGPNGCGKTTLLLTLAGIIAPTAGRIVFSGASPTEAPTRRAVVFQDFGLFHWMTVRENIAFGLVALNVSRRDRDETVSRLLSLVALTGFQDRYPFELSGGMQQRVALARALAIDPDILFLDEPFASLDLQTRDLMQEEFHRLWQDRQVTTVLVTHSAEEAIYLSHRILVLTRRPGRIKKVLDVPLDFPRSPDLRVSETFLEIRSTIWRTLREEIDGQSPSHPLANVDNGQTPSNGGHNSVIGERP